MKFDAETMDLLTEYECPDCGRLVNDAGDLAVGVYVGQMEYETHVFVHEPTCKRATHA